MRRWRCHRKCLECLQIWIQYMTIWYLLYWCVIKHNWTGSQANTFMNTQVFRYWSKCKIGKYSKCILGSIFHCISKCIIIMQVYFFRQFITFRAPLLHMLIQSWRVFTIHPRFFPIIASIATQQVFCLASFCFYYMRTRGEAILWLLRGAMFKQKRQFPKYRVVQNVLVKSGVPNLTHLIYPIELKISPNLAKPKGYRSYYLTQIFHDSLHPTQKFHSSHHPT